MEKRAWPDRLQIEREIEQRHIDALRKKGQMLLRAQATRERLGLDSFAGPVTVTRRPQR